MLPAALLLLPSLLALLAHGLSSEAPTMVEGQAPGIEETYGELTAAPTPEQPERGIHFVTTAPTLKLLNHHPLLEEFLQEGLKTGEELRPALPFQPDPPTPYTPSPLSRLANQDSRPVFTSPTPAKAAAPTQPQSREGPWSLESEPPVLHITAPLPPGPSMAVPTTSPGERLGTTPPSRAWTPTQEGPGDMGRPWAPEVMSWTTSFGTEGTVATSTASGDDEETTTTTTIITTTLTTVQPPGPCSWNFSGPEGSLDSPTAPSSPHDVGLDCFYYISVYPGYGVEIKVQNISLQEGETVTVEGLGGPDPLPLANQSFLLRGQVIRSPTHQAALRFQSLPPPTGPGTFHFHYQAFQQGHCYEPFVKYGNFSSSAPSYPVGTTVEFSCDPGYTLEQGSIIIECVDPHDPQWNETEPACRAVCSGEITDSAGVVLSPNWPEPYGRGQDCIWGVHVEEDKRIMLDIRVLRIGPGDVLTFYDGDDLTARVLGQYSGPRSHFKLFTSMADVTIQFQSDPGTLVLGYQQGFVIHFFEVPRNDTCPELPEIPNGWKSPSQPELVHGTVVTYQCYPGYQVVGSSVLMCQWDLTWSEDLPFCQRVTSCHDPGDVEHSRRLISSPKFPVGATVQYICDQGFVLTGSAILTCHDRQASSPKWSDRAPKCLLEQFKPCHGLRAPENGACSPEKRLHPAGATVHFSCAPGYVLKGEASIKCVPGHPSHWSDPPPICRADTLDGFYSGRSLDVAKAPAASSTLDAAHIAAAIFLPLVAMALLVGGVYLYFSRLQGKSPLQLPQTRPRPYDRITVESAFDNPTYETGSLSFSGDERI
ncbi:seizure protein 6 homolog isoform X7 [Pteronotus mesoamericanus]|uniref:seizure protein 6 homolog isoform X7 n=1 Tax=Pteronotus mesoamericanus TaxID=1884717 RepID=UPI0023EA9BCC|nr:seizure protein 6 homolog isoform X7 [Pteronotus parnellii mesoamericanus]